MGEATDALDQALAGARVVWHTQAAKAWGGRLWHLFRFAGHPSRGSRCRRVDYLNNDTLKEAREVGVEERCTACKGWPRDA